VQAGRGRVEAAVHGERPVGAGDEPLAAARRSIPHAAQRASGQPAEAGPARRHRGPWARRPHLVTAATRPRARSSRTTLAAAAMMTSSRLAAGFSRRLRRPQSAPAPAARPQRAPLPSSHRAEPHSSVGTLGKTVYYACSFLYSSRASCTENELCKQAQSPALTDTAVGCSLEVALRERYYGTTSGKRKVGKGRGGGGNRGAGARANRAARSVPKRLYTSPSRRVRRRACRGRPRPAPPSDTSHSIQTPRHERRRTHETKFAREKMGVLLRARHSSQIVNLSLSVSLPGSHKGQQKKL